MIVRYDSLNRLEAPKLTLCNPGSVYDQGGTMTNVVCILTDHVAEEISFNFNATSELNFRINQVPREDTEENGHVMNMFRAVQNRRLVFVDDIGYFMITGVTDGFDGHVRFKDVRAESVDVEIQQKKVPYIPDGTYRFTTDVSENNKGILDTIVEVLPLWTIGHVDNAVKNKWRTFEDVDVDKNCLSFLLEDVQNAYECIVLFDIRDRTVNVYDQANYVYRTNIHLTKSDMINTLEISEQADDLYTAVSVFGDENVTIAPVNPTGANVIYNFDYYLSWMTPSLGAKVSAWQDAIDAAFDDYYDLNSQYYDELGVISTKQSEANRLITQMTMYKRCRDNIVADDSTRLVDDYNEAIEGAGGTPISIAASIAETLANIDGLIAACQASLDTVNADIEAAREQADELLAQIDAIHNTLAIKQYFTREEYDELANYIFEGSYRDEYVTITDIMTYPEQFAQMKILYDRAVSQLERVAHPTQEFTIDSENFVFRSEFAAWSTQLQTGCLVNVELDDDDVAALFLSNITVNYDDHNLQMTFGNRYNKFDPKSLFDNVLGSVNKSANTLNYIKEILYPLKNGEFNQMQEALQTSRDLTMGAALASQNQEVIIDGSGYTGRELLDDGTYDPRQVKITGKNIVFTDDAWEHCKVALGELILGSGESTYGLNAETIIGNMIIGNGLQILNDRGEDVFVVLGDRITQEVGDVDGRLTTLETTVNGLDLTVREVTTENGNTFNNDGVRIAATGYTFRADGLTIRKSGEEIINKIDNTGMYVKKSLGGQEDSEVFEDVLVANNEGVNAINLKARQYLIIGNNSRFEDYSNGTDANRTGCFYIGPTE